MTTKANIHLFKNPQYHTRIKQIDRKYHFVCDKIETREIEVHNVHITENAAAMLTKLVLKPKLLKCLELISFDLPEARWNNQKIGRKEGCMHWIQGCLQRLVFSLSLTNLLIFWLIYVKLWTHIRCEKGVIFCKKKKKKKTYLQSSSKNPFRGCSIFWPNHITFACSTSP